MTIIINVIGQQMAVKGHKVPLAPHSENFIKLTFSLTPEWKNFKTFAQFRQSNNSPINVYLDESNSVYVPREIKAGNFTVMLYGAGESIIGTTNCLIFDMVDNCFSTDAIETDLTPTLYQQLLNEFKGYLASTKADAESATASENAAKSYATAANASAQSAATSANNATAAEKLAKDSATKANTSAELASNYANKSEESAKAASTSQQAASESQKAAGDFAKAASDSELAAGKSATTASEYADTAKTYATQAQTALTSAEEARKSASASATAANASAMEAKKSEDAVKANAEQVAQDKSAVQEYAQNAYNSAVGAESAKDDAEDARDEIRSMRAEAVTLSPGSDATASYSDGLLSLGIPRGDKGETGATGATGPKGDTGEQGPQGDKGDPGEVTQAEFDKALAKKSSAIYEGIESIPLATFADGAEDMPLKDLKVAIEPVQEGTGDPSSDNVRPITGWTGAKVTRAGKNLLPYPYRGTGNNALAFTDNGDGTITADGTPTITGFYNLFTRANPLRLKAGTYRISATGNSNIQWNFYYTDGKALSTGSNERTFTLTSDEDFTSFLRYNANVQYQNVTIKPMLVLSPETDLTYEPYQEHTYPITFPSEAGTVYGGTLDVTNGVLTVDRAQIASYAGETLPSTWISDRDVYSAGATPTTGAQVVYELATPITYHLTPQEITTLLGQNNIWADTGDTSVTYRADTKLYIDKKFTELQALILEN